MAQRLSRLQELSPDHRLSSGLRYRHRFITLTILILIILSRRRRSTYISVQEMNYAKSLFQWLRLHIKLKCFIAAGVGCVCVCVDALKSLPS